MHIKCMLWFESCLLSFGVPFGCDVTDDAGINRRCYNESPMLCSCSIQDKPIVRSCSAHE